MEIFKKWYYNNTLAIWFSKLKYIIKVLQQSNFNFLVEIFEWDPKLKLNFWLLIKYQTTDGYLVEILFLRCFLLVGQIEIMYSKCCIIMHHFLYMTLITRLLSLIKYPVPVIRGKVRYSFLLQVSTYEINKHENNNKTFLSQSTLLSSCCTFIILYR